VPLPEMEATLAARVWAVGFAASRAQVTSAGAAHASSSFRGKLAAGATNVLSMLVANHKQAMRQHTKGPDQSLGSGPTVALFAAGRHSPCFERS
jgi:hypothetical protein